LESKLKQCAWLLPCFNHLRLDYFHLSFQLVIKLHLTLHRFGAKRYLKVAIILQPMDVSRFTCC
jgi:hypothetical protein